MSNDQEMEECFQKVRDHFTLTNEQAEILCVEQRRVIEDFFVANHYDLEKVPIIVDKSSLYATITKVEQRRAYFKIFHNLDMSEYKEIALTAFWFLKFRPLMVEAPPIGREYQLLNEKLVLYCIITTLRSMYKETKKNILDVNYFFTEKYSKELLYSFANRDISKEAMILLVETCAIALKLNPYQDSESATSEINDEIFP